MAWVRAKNLSGRKAKATASKAYKTWTRIRKRCYSLTDKDFARYGGRGIRICSNWRESFSAFREWAIEAGIARDMTIDRIDNDGHYSPENCRWVPQSEQSKNRSTTLLTEDDVTYIRTCQRPIAELSSLYGLSPRYLYKVRSGDRWQCVPMPDSN